MMGTRTPYNLTITGTGDEEPASEREVTIGVGGNQFSLVSLPDVPVGSDAFASGLLDSNRNSYLIRWNPTKTSDATYAKYEYLIYGGTTPSLAFSEVEAGRGYWRKASSPYTGTFASRTSGFHTDVYPGSSSSPIGWNIIGVPFTSAIAFSSLKIDEGSSHLTWRQATDAGKVADFAWKYADSTTGYQLVTLPDSIYASYSTGSNLDPGLGYWIFVYQDAKVHLDPPTNPLSVGLAASSDSRSRNQSNQRDGHWMVQLQARAVDCTDKYNFFGCSRNMEQLGEPPVQPEGNISPCPLSPRPDSRVVPA